MTQIVAPPTEQYTRVSVLIASLTEGIANLKAARRNKPAQAVVTVGQRVEVCIDGVPQIGTVMEIHPTTGSVRVEGDQAWMHQWLPAAEVHPVPEVYPVGSRIFCRFLGMEATVVATSEYRIRVEWAERLIAGCPMRRGWLFREDCELVVEAAENAAVEETALSA